MMAFRIFSLNSLNFVSDSICILKLGEASLGKTVGWEELDWFLPARKKKKKQQNQASEVMTFTWALMEQSLKQIFFFWEKQVKRTKQNRKQYGKEKGNSPLTRMIHHFRLCRTKQTLMAASVGLCTRLARRFYCTNSLPFDSHHIWWDGL